MWNLKSKRKKERKKKNRSKFIDTENKLVVARVESGEGLDEIGEGE